MYKELLDFLFIFVMSFASTSFGVFVGTVSKTDNVLKHKITEHKHEVKTDTIDGKPVVYCTKCLDIIGEVNYNTPAVSEE